MNILFKKGYKITQNYGDRPEYYKQFGFKGHEGIDVIPVGLDWNIFSLEGGIVLRDLDDPRIGGAYGNTIVIWNKERKRAWWYCHLAENYVINAQEVAAGTNIGKMGSTGNSSGPHLHLGLRETDDQGNAINLDNGNKGFINPLPIIEELKKPQVTQPMANAEDTKLAAEFRKLQNSQYASGVWYEASNALKYIEDRINEIKDKDRTLTLKDGDLKQKDELLKNLNQHINDRNGDIKKLNAELSTLKTQLIEAEGQRDSYKEQALKVPDLTNQIGEIEKLKDYWMNVSEAHLKEIKEYKNTSYKTQTIQTLLKQVIYLMFNK